MSNETSWQKRPKALEPTKYFINKQGQVYAI